VSDDRTVKNLKFLLKAMQTELTKIILVSPDKSMTFHYHFRLEEGDKNISLEKTKTYISKLITLIEPLDETQPVDCDMLIEFSDQKLMERVRSLVDPIEKETNQFLGSVISTKTELMSKDGEVG